jgi:hypothetical protein
MSLRLLLGITLGTGVVCVAAACTSDNTSSGTNTPDAGGINLPDGSTAPSTPSIAPTTGNVLTCNTLQFKETGGSGNGTWAVSPATGSISATGLYSAPTTAPATPAVGVSYTEGALSASAQIQVATAFVGTAALPPIAKNQELDQIPFDRQASASANTVYVGLGNADNLHLDIFSSTDAGKTFTAASSYHTGHVICGTVAPDAGDPNVVYLAYLAGHDDTTSNSGESLRLAVSTDGAKTFPTTYVLADSINSLANLICPDVTSPSADHVVVTGAVYQLGVGGSPAHVGTWASSNRGASYGVTAPSPACVKCPADGSVYYAPGDTNGAAAQPTPILVNGNGYSPRTGTNGKGALCIAFQYNGASGPDPIMVQCSADSGGTWTAPVKVAAPAADEKIHPTIAVSPGGKIAVSWVDTVGTAIDAFVTISTDGGKTFGMAVQVPALTVSDNFGVNDPVVAWESDDVLWVSESANVGNAETMFVDKTCDLGKTWSGAVKVAAGKATSLVKTTNGMLVVGNDTQKVIQSVYPLSGQ